MNLNAQQIKDACDGEFLVEPKDTTVFAVSIKIDSRKIECGDMFVAFKGENVDGHDFIKDVINKKASIILCEKDLDEDVLNFAKDNLTTIIKVKNSAQAITDVAIEWRKNLIGKVVAITGSVGKTSTKNFTNIVLSSKYKTTANKGNLNNEIGLPITLCSSNFDDDFVITEMGMSNFGEIDDLCKIAQPVWGLITNVGVAHIEFLKSRENIAKAKSELALSIPDEIGKMILPTDDDYRDFIIDFANLKSRNVEIIYYGGTNYHSELEGAQVWYEDVSFNDKGIPRFTVCAKGFQNIGEEKLICSLNIPGKHSIINACGAIAIGLLAGIDLSNIIESISELESESGRQEIIKSVNGFTIINDAYNANPQSMLSAIDSLNYVKCKGKKIAFLGDMKELGDFSEDGHKAVGEAVAKNNLDLLICVGEDSEYISTAAKKFGMNQDKVKHFENVEEATKFLNNNINSNDVVLFKASNSMGFQNVVKEMAG